MHVHVCHKSDDGTFRIFQMSGEVHILLLILRWKAHHLIVLKE